MPVGTRGTGSLPRWPSAWKALPSTTCSGGWSSFAAPFRAHKDPRRRQCKPHDPTHAAEAPADRRWNERRAGRQSRSGRPRGPGARGRRVSRCHDPQSWTNPRALAGRGRSPRVELLPVAGGPADQERPQSRRALAPSGPARHAPMARAIRPRYPQKGIPGPPSAETAIAHGLVPWPTIDSAPGCARACSRRASAQGELVRANVLRASPDGGARSDVERAERRRIPVLSFKGRCCRRSTATCPEAYCVLIPGAPRMSSRASASSRAGRGCGFRARRRRAPALHPTATRSPSVRRGDVVDLRQALPHERGSCGEPGSSSPRAQDLELTGTDCARSGQRTR
jgi:hypothetical protein